MTLPLAHETWFEHREFAADWGFAAETARVVLLAAAAAAAAAALGPATAGRSWPARRRSADDPGAAPRSDVVEPRGRKDRCSMRPLSDPRPLIAPLRTIDSAQTSLRRLPDRRLLMTIRHAPLRGVTPEMLVWWFQNIEGSIEIDGREYPRYLIWHPYDHIHYDATRHRDGSVSAGVRFHIVEAFGRDPALRVETRDHVDLLDTSGLRLSARFAGVEVFALHHRFTRTPGGTQYDSTMVVGVAGTLGRLVNPLLNRRVFGERHGHAWIRHNIEEVGLLEELLARLGPGAGASA